MQCSTERTLSGPPMFLMMSRARASKPVRPSSTSSTTAGAGDAAAPAATGTGADAATFTRASAIGCPIAAGPRSSDSASIFLLLVTMMMAVVSLPAATTSARFMVPIYWPAVI